MIDDHLKVSSSLTMSDFSKLRAMLPERTPYVSLEEMAKTAEKARATRMPIMAELISFDYQFRAFLSTENKSEKHYKVPARPRKTRRQYIMTEQDAIDFMANHTAQQIYDAGVNGTALDGCYIGEAFFNQDDTIVQRAVLVAVDGSAAWMVIHQSDGTYTAQPAKSGWVGWTPNA